MAHRRGARRTEDVDADDVEEMVQNYDHPYIQFPKGSVFHRKLQTLKNRKLVKTNSISWKLLRDVGEETWPRNMLNPAWEKFFNIKGPIYQDLYLEFLSTYTFDPSVRDVNRADAITFNLGGMSYKFSIAEFGEVIGVYTAEETRNDGFKNSLTKFPDDISEQSFWAEIGVGIYEANNKTKATAMYDPLHKYFHRVISESIGGRRVTGTGVNMKDLFLLYCLIKKQPCNIAYMLADYFTHCIGRQGKFTDGHLCGGTYVTHIAKQLELLNEDNLEQLSDPVLFSGVVGREIINITNGSHLFNAIN